jgi:hypothetical protein
MTRLVCAIPVLFGLFCSLTFGAAAVPAQPAGSSTDQCFACHSTIGDKPSSLFTRDIHHRKGISCAGCHGGNSATDDPEQAMNKAAGFIGVPHGDQISAMCARCHASSERMQQYGSKLPTDQFSSLQTSAHGALSTTGKERIVQCSTCHNAHGIARVTEPASPVYPLNIVATCTKCHANPTFMRTYNPSLPVDQGEKYRTSVHGMRNAKGDTRVAECASCHGSHAILPASEAKSKVYAGNVPATCGACHSDAERMKPYGIPTDQVEKFTRSVHGIALLQKHDAGAPACNSCHGNHGATPPGVESISKVCGTCHALNADLFSSSPHKAAFDSRHLPECETCHGNHEIIAATNKLLGVAPEAVCSRCHTPTDNVRGYKVAAAMRNLIDSLERAEATAKGLVDEAEQKGMEIAEAKFKLRDARQARLEARTAIHAFNEERFRGVVGKGLVIADDVSAAGREALEEYLFRRIGLGISTLIISILAVGLYFWIRRKERPGVRGKS